MRVVIMVPPCFEVMCNTQVLIYLLEARQGLRRCCAADAHSDRRCQQEHIALAGTYK